MADQEEVLEVIDMLGTDAAAEGWDETRIISLLDDGESPNQIARRYWEFRMTRTHKLADVSESGSSRRLSQIFSNSAAMAAYYRGAAEAEDPANQPSGTNCRPIRRV